MKISELIKVLNYELESTGDSDVIIALDLRSKETVFNKYGVATCRDLMTSCDFGDGNQESVFFIQTNGLL